MSTPSFRQFVIMVIGLSVAVLGSLLTEFALGVWAYQKGGSVTDFTMISLAASLPLALFSPIAGAAVDRWNRKLILLVGQLAAIAITGTMALLYSHDALQVWHIVLLSALQSMFNAFVFPAITASIPLMVKTDQLTRANSVISLALGMAQLLAPAIAGGLMATIGIKFIFLLNLATFAVGVVVLLITPIPQPPVRDHHDPLNSGKFLDGIVHGWRYMSGKPGLQLLNLWTSLLAFNMFAIMSLLTPMVLSFSNESGLGLVLSMAGFGTLFGSVAMLAVKNTDNKNMRLIMIGGVVACIMYIASPLVSQVWYVAACTFIVASTFPLFNVCGQVIFQRKIAPEFQGRVAGLRNFLRLSMQPLALLVIGPLVDKLIGPAMLQGGALTPWFGPLIGEGPGRGAALLVFLIGVLSMVWMVLGWLSPIRHLEQRLPNHDVPSN